MVIIGLCKKLNFEINNMKNKQFLNKIQKYLLSEKDKKYLIDIIINKNRIKPIDKIEYWGFFIKQGYSFKLYSDNNVYYFYFSLNDIKNIFNCA